MADRDILAGCIGFEWDLGNVEKIWQKHGVTEGECEQMFFNQPLVIEDDIDHSMSETRWYALGRTDKGRMLFAAFTMREDRIRMISARDMSRKERKVYESYG